MIRHVSLTILAIAAVGLTRSVAAVELPIAPPPREIRPDGTRNPAPPPEPPKAAEDPAAVVDRIIKNSKDVGEKLAKTDTGTNTRNTQSKILKDIDTLIDRQENPPPPQPNDNKDKDKDKDKGNNSDMNSPPKMPDMTPPKGGDMPMDKQDMGNKSDGMPMDKMGKGEKQDGMPMDMNGMGMSDPQPPGHSRRPRMGEPQTGDKKEQGDPKPEGMGDKQKSGGSKDPKDPSGGSPGGKLPPAVGSLPFEDDVAKDVWGHLPPKLRQQMAQYYKEDVTPKYAELLRLYYSSLAEKPSPIGGKK